MDVPLLFYIDEIQAANATTLFSLSGLSICNVMLWRGNYGLPSARGIVIVHD